MQAEAQHGDDGNSDLAKLEPLRHRRLVVAIRELAPQRRQEEEGSDEDRGSQGDQGIGTTQLEQNKKYERVLEEIVTECREELAPEQGREAPRHEKG